MQPSKILDVLKEAVLRGGLQALRNQWTAKTVSDAGGGDLTTDQDVPAQEVVVGYIGEKIPGVEVLSEEGESRDRVETGVPRVIIDPIDGSYSYKRQGGDWCTTAGYYDGTDMSVGVVFQPAQNILAWAVRSGGCWIQRGNETPQQVMLSDRPFRPQDETIYMPMASVFSDEVVEQVQPQILKQVRFVYNNICNTGSIIAMLTHFIDGMVAWAKLWDFAAGKVMVEEAGGYVCDFWGEPMDNGLIVPQRILLVRSREMADALLPYTAKWPKEGDLRA